MQGKKKWEAIYSKLTSSGESLSSNKVGDALQIHRRPSSNKVVLQGPALKRYNSLQDDSLQEVMVQFTRQHDSLQDTDLIVCKMTVYKRL